MSKKTIKTIIDSGNDYLVAVKGNQPTLLRECQTIAAECQIVDCDERSNHGHGRSERRIVSVWDAPREGDPLAIDGAWAGLRRIIRVERFRWKSKADNAPSVETAYYISSRRGDRAETLGEMIRGHWGIENRLHWVKDVQQNEDRNGIGRRGARLGNAPENISLLKSWVLSLFRIKGYDSIKNATITFANRIPRLLQLVIT